MRYAKFFLRKWTAAQVLITAGYKSILPGLCFFLCTVFSIPADAGHKSPRPWALPIKVMTRNIYVGADIYTLLSGDPTNPLRIPMNVAALMNSANQTDIFERADALAAEIGFLRPDLIGLQEVSLIRTQSPEAPASQPYNLITNAGFKDVWTRNFEKNDPGYTCCQEADLLNEPSQLEERIDLIFVRNDAGFLPFSIIGPSFAIVVGDEQWNRTPSGLWPSDHAGVQAWLWLPNLKKW